MKLKQYFIVAAALCLLFQSHSVTAKTQNETKKIYGIAGPTLQYHAKKANSKTYTVKGVRYRTVTAKEAENYAKQGTATFYHSKFVGRKTSSGEIYNEKLFTAAHKTLPFNSYVLVTNLHNHRQVIVRINDRGPFHSNRIIDLSKAAAKELGMTAQGTAKVKLDMVIIDHNGNISGNGGKTLLASQKAIQTKNANVTQELNPEFMLTARNIENREQVEKLISALSTDDIKTEIKQNGDKFNIHFGPLTDREKINKIKTAFSRLNLDNGQLYTYRNSE